MIRQYNGRNVINLMDYTLVMGENQEVTIDCNGGIIYEGTLGDCPIPAREMRRMEVYGAYSTSGRVPHEIVITCSKEELI